MRSKHFKHIADVLLGIGLLLLIVQLEQFIRLIFTLRRYNTYVWAKDLTKLVKE